MSNKLALSTALSVLMMSGYVLFGPDAAQAPLGPQMTVPAFHASVPAMPDPARLLPFVR